MNHSQDIKSILKENHSRNSTMDIEFNPITGIGSLVPRKQFTYTDGDRTVSYLAPVTMFDLPVIRALEEAGDIQMLIELNEEYTLKKHQELSKYLYELRLDHDFEFYCYTCVKIPEKIPNSTGDGDLIPFKLNKPQRRLVSRFERMRVANVPIRFVIAKARQWGGSTVTQIYENWIQLRHRKRWNMAICTFVNAQASHIRNMMVRTVKGMPTERGKMTITNYAGTQSNKYIPERDCIIGVGSTQAPENLRTYNIHLGHFSEVGSWKDTPQTSARSLAQSLRGTIADIPYTMLVLESTPKGVGNFFYDEWIAAEKGNSGYEAFFVPWFEIEMYRKPILDMETFIESLDSLYMSDGTTYWYLWELGATLEGINWYKNKKESENMDEIQMMQEFPSTAEEGFSSTGRPAFNHLHIKRMEKGCCAPEFKGELIGKTRKGKDSIADLEFIKSPHGNLWIWSLPDKSILMNNRYCCFADIGGKGAKADYSVVKVFDRYWMSEGGVPEVCAIWRGHLDQDLFAFVAAQIASFYNDALLAIETNSLKTMETEGASHFLTVIDEIAPFYKNLYTRTTFDEIKQGLPVRYGWHTNISTKPLLVDTLNSALRDGLYSERDQRSLDECYNYELKDNGTFGAKDGKKDDLVICTAGGLWLSLKYMPIPKIIVPSGNIKRGGIVSEASL